MLDAWLRINADGTATVFTGKVELGQGILTALAQIAAEELDLPLARSHDDFRRHRPHPERGQDRRQPVGRESGTALRLAAAEVRAILIELASKRLEMSADTLSVADGVISAADGKRMTYGELAAAVDLKREATATVRPKPVGQHKIVGQSIPRFDIPGKVTGKAVYVQDLRLPGMVHGRVVRPPQYGATLASLDDSKARAMPGVIAVVRDGCFLGVVAEREEQAVKARAALAEGAKWKAGPELPDPAQLFEHMKSLPTKDEVIGVEAGADARERAEGGRGDLHQALHGARLDRAVCAVAEFKDGKMTVWTHTQGVFPLRAEIVQGAQDAAGCRPLHPYRRLRLLWPQRRRRRRARCGAARARGARQAGAAAVDARRRVRLGALWPRHGDAGEGVARRTAASSTGTTRCGATATRRGRMSTDRRERARRLVSGRAAADGAAHHAAPAGRRRRPQRDPALRFSEPAGRAPFHPADADARVGAAHAGAYANVFAAESFMDELAVAAGADPVAFRLAHMKDPRARAVIEAVAEMANWKPGEKGDLARGRGIGFSKYKNLACYCAVIADVEVDRASGRVRVTHAWSVADAGIVINPDGLIHQIEGGVIQSASWTLHEEVRFDKKGILSRDWSTYPILTMPEVPQVEVALINRPDERALGAGEGSQGPAVAAIANAFAHATGKRIRDLPFHPERVKAVLA